MGNTQVYHDNSYLVEVWALFGVATAMVIARYIVRLRTVGWRRFQGDDYMAFLVYACYATCSGTITIIYWNGAAVDYVGQDVSLLSPAQVHAIEFGSKMEIITSFAYITLIWGLKGCMLFFYNRLTFGLTQQIFVKALAVACVATYLGMCLEATLICLPFHWNWQVRPMPPLRCTARRENFYVITVLNVVTDVAIISVPVPLLWRLRIGKLKKLGVGMLICSGGFVTTAAIVRAVETLGSSPSALTINRWGIREIIAGILAVNAPIVKPLFTRQFWSRNHRLPSISTAAGKAGSEASGLSPRTKNNGFTTFFRKVDTVELVDGSDEIYNTGKTAEDYADCENAKPQHEANGRVDSTIGEECIIQKPEQAANPHPRDHIDLESALLHPGLRLGSPATSLAPNDDSDAKIGAMREPVVSRPQRVFHTSIGEELDSKKGHPHPGVRIPTPGRTPTPGSRDQKKAEDIPDVPPINREEGVLTPWPEEQKFSPWGYDTELTNMDKIHGDHGQRRSRDGDPAQE